MSYKIHKIVFIIVTVQRLSLISLITEKQNPYCENYDNHPLLPIDAFNPYCELRKRTESV